MFFVLVTALLHAGNVANAASCDDNNNPCWSDLAWSDLESKLSPSASLIQTSPTDYVDQCYPEFLKQRYSLDPDQPIRSHHNLVDQPSGLCMNQLYCAFKRCNPLPPEEAESLTVKEKWDEIVVGKNPELEQDVQGWLDASNPSYNLPSTVIFPVVAGDVAAAVGFAVENGLGVSVKNSGHSYTGASTKRDTVHINMNQYKPYSPTGVTECPAPDTSDDADFLQDLGDQPCRLAGARGKPAVLRVGGGENFGEVYVAVKEYNEAAREAQDGGAYKYHLVGGAAGTVSPMGWTWQGGLAGTTGGRQHGFGVDQVLRIDMVLPNGRHVRFGPTEWEDEDDGEGYAIPRTTAVSGVCHENPEESDETKWVWKACPEDAGIDFDDLWFAVNGGGGGTWGVVTSVYLQLHEYGRLEAIQNGIDSLEACGLPAEHRDALEAEWWNFYIEFLFEPSALGVTKEESDRCASSTYNFLFCYGEDSSETYTSAWTRYIGSRNQTLADAGVPISIINLVAGCTGNVIINDDFADFIIIKEGPNKGKAQDSPSPSYASTSETDVNLLVPARYILENRDAAREMILATDAAPYCAFGGNAGFAQDRANSLSKAHRLGGWMLIIPLDVLTESFYTDVFPEMFDTTDGDDFPGFVGSNHAGPNMRGPLRDDWTKPCPLDWTQEERDKGCISLQEAIWGTETLRRLESIKEDIDPDYTFACYGCIGNDRAPASAPHESDQPIQTGAPSGSSLSTWKVGALLVVAFELVHSVAISLWS